MQGILVSGKPHLGTDRLVLLLRAFRARLVELGVDLRFGATMADLLVQRGRVCGVRLRGASSEDKVFAVGGPCLRQCLSAWHGLQELGRSAILVKTQATDGDEVVPSHCIT